MSPPHKFRTTPASNSPSYRGMGELSPRRAPRVLVVDDNPDTMVLMRELLATRGYQVIAVASAALAEN
jgi:response regulator RpfG family c-di-GMP phosphodiesterase